MSIEEVELARDTRGFVRRTCPACARSFKLSGGPAEEPAVQAVFAAALRHANADEIGDLVRRFCPYCGHAASAEAFLTGAQRRYIEARARLAAVLLRDVILRESSRPGLRPPTFAPLRAGPIPAPVPPPEPDDLRTARVLCCGEQIKLKPSWREAYFCPHCRARQGA